MHEPSLMSLFRGVEVAMRPWEGRAVGFLGGLVSQGDRLISSKTIVYCDGCPRVEGSITMDMKSWCRASPSVFCAQGVMSAQERVQDTTSSSYAPSGKTLLDW
ncbi:hypothetical protein J1614_003580 [Plenodomus biglobosus]|nr:hypothetical protein J1614_003580 [Plenodomus biglobosus]